MKSIVITVVLFGLLLAFAPVAGADDGVTPIACEVDMCASPYLWLYKASEGTLDGVWYASVARAFNCFARTGDDYALYCVVRWMGLEEFWTAYRAYCVHYMSLPTFRPMVEPIGTAIKINRMDGYGS